MLCTCSTGWHSKCAFFALSFSLPSLSLSLLCCCFFSTLEWCCQVNNKYNMQIKIIKREERRKKKNKRSEGKKLKTKIYSNNTNEYFVYFLKKKRKEKEKIFNIKEFYHLERLYALYITRVRMFCDKRSSSAPQSASFYDKLFVREKAALHYYITRDPHKKKATTHQKKEKSSC